MQEELVDLVEDEIKPGCFNDKQIILMLSIFKPVLENYVSGERRKDY